MMRKTTPPPPEGAAPASSVHPALRDLEDGVGRRWLEALLSHGERAQGPAAWQEPGGRPAPESPTPNLRLCNP
jgi:hypothetical protein